LTGQYQQRTGIEGVVTAKNHRHTGLALKEKTFAEILKTAQYKTALFGKWHLGYSVEFNPIKQGFDEFRGYVSGNVDYQSHIDQVGYEDWWKNENLVPDDGYSTYLITEYSLQFIEKHKNNPFCLYIAHECPHYPYQGPQDPADREPGDPHPIWGRREDREKAYQEMIVAMDTGIGQIIQKLKALNIDKNTFIFFCSDNGHTGVGSGGPLRGHKGTVWEGGHRVPAIAYWPGKIQPNTISDQTIMSMDLFPTMATLVGRSDLDDLNPDGVDISPVFLNNQQVPKRTLFWRFGDQKAVRDGRWKLLVNPKSSESSDNQVYLFDLEQDLSEKTNLSEKFPQKTKVLLNKLEIWEKRVSAGVIRKT
jgi:arylsulfatase A-like enzyme